MERQPLIVWRNGVSCVLRRDTVMYANDDSQEAVAEAMEYIMAQGLTKADVKLIQREGQTLVIAIREMWK